MSEDFDRRMRDFNNVFVVDGTRRESGIEALVGARRAGRGAIAGLYLNIREQPLQGKKMLSLSCYSLRNGCWQGVLHATEETRRPIRRRYECGVNRLPNLVR